MAQVIPDYLEDVKHHNGSYLWVSPATHLIEWLASVKNDLHRAQVLADGPGVLEVHMGSNTRGQTKSSRSKRYDYRD